jgi:hypothetical protein
MPDRGACCGAAQKPRHKPVTALAPKLLSNGTDSSIDHSYHFQMTAKSDSVPIGRIVPAVPARSRFASKGKEEGRREPALFLGGDTQCRKDRFFLRSFNLPSSRRHKIRLILATRSCISSNLNEYGQRLPKASITGSRCASPILPIMWRTGLCGALASTHCGYRVRLPVHYA